MDVKVSNKVIGDKPIEEIADPRAAILNRFYREQYACSVLDYTSKYNNISSISYSPENVTGRPARYPQYGDFPETYSLRSYGKWWRESEAAQKDYMPQDVENIISEDYIILGFQMPIIPSNVIIYETYNPGAVVRLWGRLTGHSWYLLYEAPPEVHALNARKFMPEIKQIKDLINEVRIEFNQSLLNYHTSLDSVILAGYCPTNDLYLYLLKESLNDVKTLKVVEEQTFSVQDGIVEEGIDYISQLPYEVMVHIFKYLDLKSLARCAQVNKIWQEVSLDSAIYQAISLKKYWVMVNNGTLKYFKKRCNNLKKLDLSWCGYDKMITEDVFQEFLKKCGNQLTHLSLCNCNFVKNVAMGTLSKCSDLIELRLRNCFPDPWTFSFLVNLSNLVALDLYSTTVMDDTLIKILKSNRQLKHLILDFCENLDRMDEITETVSLHNTQLVTFSCWKTRSLSARGVRHLGRCHELRELDMGWCLILTDPEDCLEIIARGCKNLRRLILSNWRGLSDSQLRPVVTQCTQLVQLDLLGIKNITSDICDVAMDNLPNLKMLDVSFCEYITHGHILMFQIAYPHVIVYRN